MAGHNSDFAMRRLAGALGARITGLDLAFAIPGEVLTRLKESLEEHAVLVFPGQGHLTPQQHVDFAAQWGPLHIMPSGHLLGHEALIEIASRGGAKPGAAFAGAGKHESSNIARTDI